MIKYLTVLVLLAFSLILGRSVAAQSVSGVIGTVAHGDTVAISGSLFGTKTNANPVAWDDMENGAFSPRWTSANDLQIGSSSRHPQSQYCGTINFQGSLGQGAGYFTGGSPSEYWFGQYWFKLDPNFDWGFGAYGSSDANLSSVKLFRMWNPGDTRENFILYVIGVSYPTRIRYQTDNVGEGDLSGSFVNYQDWSKGDWHLLQFEFKDGSLGVADGEFRVWFDGQLKSENTGVTRLNDDVLKRPLILGFYDSWNDGGTDRDDFYVDDAYIDNTWARVEIGDAAAYDSCTHREIQIPTAWSADSINICVNTGSFADKDAAYLFVVDADGNISDQDAGTVGAQGYPVTINSSAGSSAGAPPKPTNLSATRTP